MSWPSPWLSSLRPSGRLLPNDSGSSGGYWIFPPKMKFTMATPCVLRGQVLLFCFVYLSRKFNDFAAFSLTSGPCGILSRAHSHNAPSQRLFPIRRAGPHHRRVNLTRIADSSHWTRPLATCFFFFFSLPSPNVCDRLHLTSNDFFRSPADDVHFNLQLFIFLKNYYFNVGDRDLFFFNSK